MLSKNSFKKSNTIRGQITLWFSLFFLLLMTILIVLIIVISEVSLQTNTKDRLKSLVNNNVLELEYLDDEHELDSDEGDYYIKYGNGYLEIDDDFILTDNGIQVALYDGNTIIYGQNPIETATSDLSFEDQTLRKINHDSQSFYVFDAKVTGNNIDNLWLRGIINTRADVTVIEIIIHLILIIVPLLVVSAIVGGYFISKRLLSPFENISEQVELIEDGNDLSQRIQVSGKNLEVSRLRDNFNLMLQRLQDSFEAEKQFTSDASHELRTPISVIAAECEYALETSDPDDLEESLTVIARQNKKMARLVEDLLTFTRIEQKTIQTDFETLNVNDLIDEVIEEQGLLWADKNITVHRDYAKDALLDGDRALLVRLIQNLIQNAYKYGIQNGNIYLKTWLDNNKCVFSVKDDGIGIKEKELPLIWNRFYRADSARSNSNSTGLGLAMVKQIAELHGANVSANSLAGKGSEFIVKF